MFQISRSILRFRISKQKIFNERHKYIVLLPEVPSDTPETNPLLRGSGELPSFLGLTPAQCMSATGKLLIEYESGVHQLEQKIEEEGLESTVQNVVLPLDRLSGPLDFVWGTFKLLYTVKRDQGFAEAYIRLHPRLIRAKQEKFLSPYIYKAFKELKGAQLTSTVRRIVDKHLLESEMCGVHLSDASYGHYQTIMKNLNKNRNTFDQNVSESTSKFRHDLSSRDVRNFPPDLIRMLAVDQSNPSRGPWVLTLAPASYHSFLEHCDDRMLRWNVWHAYNTRANTTRQFNNSIPLEEIRHQRSELAKLLGYSSFAELSMQTKMAGCVENVTEMITTLQVHSRSAMLQEVEQLQAFASRNGHHYALEPWDVPYWQRLHKEELFQIDDDVVRQYFPYSKVLQGVFELCHKLFGVKIEERTGHVDVWHPDVKLYSILDESGKEVAQFFMDPYHRYGEKLPGAWLEVGRSRSEVVGCRPLSYLVCDFPRPQFGQDSHLSFADVRTLLGKMGHLLQHSLAVSPYSEVAGLNNLEWDVVGVCPRVFSALASRSELLALLTNQPIPAPLHNAILRREKYMQGLHMAEELFYSALDQELYSSKEFWASACKRLWTEFLPFPYEKDFARPCSLSEIFTGPYPAAYFSDLWAQMIAADVFGAFEETSDSEKLREIGHRFRDTFLCLGGSCHPSEVFRKFRGRDPSADALLLSLGFTAPPAEQH